MSDAAQETAAAIRAKLASGELPSAKPEKVWAAKGTDQLCTACSLPITADDIECDVDFPGVRAAMRLHQACLIAWDQHRKDFPPRVDAA